MKTYLTAFAGLALTACSPVSSTPAPSAAALCEQTVRDYAVLRDRGPVEDYANLFTPNGTFYLGDTVTTGREALIARHVGANKAAIWNHTMGDIRITETNGQVSGVSRVIVRTGPHPAPTTVTREIVADYVDTFVIEGGACKIATRKVNISFDTAS